MTTKGPSRKQVIIPMSRENINSFMKSSSLYVANLNRLLHNAKSEVLTDYIRANPIGITIVTNKVSQQSDMAIINNLSRLLMMDFILFFLFHFSFLFSFSFLFFSLFYL